MIALLPESSLNKMNQSAFFRLIGVTAEMDKPIYLSYRPTLDDIVDGSMAVRRAATPAFGCLTMGCLVVIASFSVVTPMQEWVVLAFAVLFGFVLMMRSRAFLKGRLRSHYKDSPLLKSSVEWWITDEEFVSATSASEGRYRWEMVKRIVELRHFFMIILYSSQHPFFPSRAFHSREDVDRFIALARAKAPRYDVIKPLEYVPGLDEKPVPLEE